MSLKYGIQGKEGRYHYLKKIISLFYDVEQSRMKIKIYEER